MFGVQRKKKSIRQKIVTTESDEEVEIIEQRSEIINKTSLLSFNDEENDAETFKIKKSKKHKTRKIIEPVKNVNDKGSPKQTINKEIPAYEEEEISSVLRTGSIPNASIIFAAKKHRQMAREIITESETYHVSNEKIFEKVIAQEKTVNSRLIRDDENDNSDEGDETLYGNKMARGNETCQHPYNEPPFDIANAKALLMNQNHHNKNNANNHSGLNSNDDDINEESEIDSEEEEYRRWENEQIKKGYNMPQLLNLPTQHQTHVANIIQNLTLPMTVLSGNLYSDTINEPVKSQHPQRAFTDINKEREKFMFVNKTSSLPKVVNQVDPSCDLNGNTHQESRESIDINRFNKKTTIPNFIMEDMKTFKITQNFDSDLIKKDIEKRIESLNGRLSGFRGDLNSTVEFQNSNHSLHENLNYENRHLEGEYELYDRFKEYIDDLIDCHNEKMATVIAYENRIQNLWKQRANKIMNRRQQDLKDESQEYSFNSMTNLKTTTNDPGLKRRANEREARRSRRIRCREKDKNEAYIDFGYSSDDEETQAEVESFKSQLETILNESSNVFTDVLDHYADPGCIINKFTEWKDQYSNSYHEAYVNMYLTNVLQNLIRLVNLDWNPLDFTDMDGNLFEDRDWFLQLNRLIDTTSNSPEPYKNDIDSSLVSNTTSLLPGSKATAKIDNDSKMCTVTPNVIQNVFLPKLTFVIQNVYDPLSRTQTQRFTRYLDYFSKISPFFYAENQKIQEFYKALQDRIVKSLENDLYIPILPINSINETMRTKYISYQSRQIWTAIKLLENICYWNSLVSYEFIKELAVDGILHR